MAWWYIKNRLNQKRKAEHVALSVERGYVRERSPAPEAPEAVAQQPEPDPEPETQPIVAEHCIAMQKACVTSFAG